MILRRPGETTLDALERTGREMSVSPLIMSGPMATTHIYELIGALATEIKVLREEIQREAYASEPNGADPETR